MGKEQVDGLEVQLAELGQLRLLPGRQRLLLQPRLHLGELPKEDGEGILHNAAPVGAAIKGLGQVALQRERVELELAGTVACELGDRAGFARLISLTCGA